MTSTTVSVLEGNTFVVSARNGDIDGSPSEPHGLFHHDTRFLSRLLLTIEGKPLQPLSTDDREYFDVDLEHRPPALERRRRRGEGGQVCAALARCARLLGLGCPHDGRGEAGYNPIGYHQGTVWHTTTR
jgi:glycogen debranching enzyme